MVANPQSVQATTRDGPKIFAKYAMRWHTSSADSTEVEHVSTTPGYSTLSSGTLSLAKRMWSAACLLFAPSNESPWALILNAVGRTCSTPTSRWWVPG